jgi:uncharacterized membrane protein
LIHPVLVHFPIAFYFLELLLWGFYILKKEGRYVEFAKFSFHAGYLFMIAAMLAGYWDAGGIVPRVRRHFFSALGVLIFYTIRTLYWHFCKPAAPSYLKFQIGGSLAGNFLVGMTAYFGGELVYGPY